MEALPQTKHSPPEAASPGQLAACLMVSFLQQRLALPQECWKSLFGELATLQHLSEPSRSWLSQLPADLRGLFRLALADPALKKRLHRALRRAQEHQIQAVSWLGDAYPPALRAISGHPLVLYYRGHLPWSELTDKRCIVITGTRRPTPYGKSLTVSLAGSLAKRGILVASGLATGIDQAAHHAALVAGGPTIAVVGCGLDRVFPPQHQALTQSIAARGLILSEQPPGTIASKASLIARQRILSGIAQAVVIPEARRSGRYLNTVAFAADQGRDVWAIPGPVTAAASEGCNRLLQDGAAVLLHVSDLL